jgi:hypothetical protein
MFNQADHAFADPRAPGQLGTAETLLNSKLFDLFAYHATPPMGTLVDKHQPTIGRPNRNAAMSVASCRYV